MRYVTKCVTYLVSATVIAHNGDSSQEPGDESIRVGKSSVMKRSIFILLAVLVMQVMGGCASEPAPHKQLTPVIKAKAVPFSGYMYNCREQGNYGMYSYLVMAYPGNSQNFIEIIQVFLEKTFKLNQRNKSVDKGLLNNVFIPLWSSPPSWVREVGIEDHEQLDATARWVAQNYDYKCARLIMRSIPKSNRNSIYVMSSLARLTTGGKSSIVMIQEVSNSAEPSRFKLVDEFFKKIWHQRHWTEQSVKDVAALLTLAVEGDSSADQLDVPISEFLSEVEPDQKMEEAQANAESQVLAGSEETTAALGQDGETDAVDGKNSLADQFDVPISGDLSEVEPDQKMEDAQANAESQVLAVPGQDGETEKQQDNKKMAEEEKLQVDTDERQVVISKPIDNVPLSTKGSGSGIITVVLPN